MMNIELDDGIAAALNAKAAEQGLTMLAFLEAVAFRHPAQTSSIKPDELDRFLDAEATSGHSPSGSFSRTELYSDHD